MLKRELLKYCTEISREFQLPMDDVKNVLNSYLSKIENRTEVIERFKYAYSILTGIPAIDNHIKFHPGVIVIYSHPDYGRTSVAKRMALSAMKQGLNTFYYDVENKLMLHDPALFAGMGVANSYTNSGLNELVYNGLIDFIVVDTITGIHKISQESFLIQLKKKVPYILVLTQMRDFIQLNKSGPAAKDHVLSSAHTNIFLSNKEKVTIESIDVLRVQLQITKYEKDPGIEGIRESFIIRNNIVDNVYSLYDLLRSSGLIKSMGKEKYYQGINNNYYIGAIKEAVKYRKDSERILRLGMNEINLKTPLEVYLD